MSLIERILNPLACKALNAVSLPDPGPLISTVKVFIPTSKALAAAASAATWAAYGVDFLDPLNPFDPADAHEITFPLSSAIVTIVLLNVALTKAMPVVIFFLIFFLTTLTFLTFSTLSASSTFFFFSFFWLI